MASKNNLVAAGGRSSKGLDKKPIWLKLAWDRAGRPGRPGLGSC